MWIRVQGKARGGEKAEHTRQYVSILSRPATPPWRLRPVFEMGSSVGGRHQVGEGHQNRRMKKREDPAPVQVGKALQYDVDIDPKLVSLLLWCVSR